MKTILERENGTRRVMITFPEDEPASVSVTKPEFHRESDINQIMARYAKTGILGNPLSYREGMYGDFSSGEDFASAMRKVTDMQRVFEELPSAVRNRFNNDPRLLVDFLVDPRNDEEAIKLGLKVRLPVDPPAAEVPVAPAAPVVPAASAAAPST